MAPARPKSNYRGAIAGLLGLVVVSALGWQVPAMLRIDGPIAPFGILLTTDTEYAEGYSHNDFAQIELGMSEAAVIDLLGEPLTRWTPYSYKGRTKHPERAHYIGLVYSRSPSSSNYRLRDVILDNGKVAEIRGYFYAD